MVRRGNNRMSTYKKENTRTYYDQHQIDELKRCQVDPVYFIENYATVLHATRGEIPFILYEYQKELLYNYQHNRNVISLMPRQSGKTEASAAYLLWEAMFKKNQNILMAAHVWEHVAEIMKRIKFVYEGLPDWLRAGVKRDGYNARSIKFGNGSTIQGVTTTPSSGRGKSISLLYLDEFSFVKPGIAKEFWASISPTLSTGGRCIITSTPNVDDDEFAQIWFGANNTTDENGKTIQGGVGRNGFKSFTVKWDEHPDRDEDWKAVEHAKIGEERWLREFECRFISFDETLINSIFLNEEINKMSREPLYSTGQVRWYHPVKPNATYVVGMDPSMGTGGDNCAIEIFELPSLIQVAEWRDNRTRIPEQIKILMQVLKFLHSEMAQNVMQKGEPDIYWSVENNTLGEASLIVIAETGEENFPGQMLTESKRSGSSRVYRRGFNTSNKRKVEACAKLKSTLESGRMHIQSKALIRELKFFVAKGPGFQAKQGETDDLVMATILCLRMVQEILIWDGNMLEQLSENVLGSGFEEEIIEPMPTIIL